MPLRKINKLYNLQTSAGDGTTSKEQANSIHLPVSQHCKIQGNS